MGYTKYIGYGGTSTLLLLITWFISSSHFAVQYEGDSICAGSFEDPCEWKYNITLVTVPTYYIQNKDSVKLVFLPDVRGIYHCKKDGRYSSSKRLDREEYPCGVGWREFDWKTPLTSRYKYINKFLKNKKQEFKIVVFKFNPEDDIKFGGEITKDEFDPFFLGISSEKFTEEIEIKPNIFKIDECTNASRIVDDICFLNLTYLHNITFINNRTGINTTHTEFENYTRRFKCNSHTEYFKDECETIAIRNLVNRLNCLEGYRCDVVSEEFCMLNCNDGDCNYNAKQSKGWGWNFRCLSIYDIKRIKFDNRITAEVSRI